MSSNVLILRYVYCELDDLGVKGKSGILATQASQGPIFVRPYASHSVRLHPEALFLAESDRDLVQYFGASSTETQ